MKKTVVAAFCILAVLGSGCGKSLEKQIAEQLNMGEKYLSEGDYEAAVVAFQKAIELDPKVFDVYVKCAEAYSEMNDYENAISVFENGVELIGVENVSDEDTDFWKEMYYDWEMWEEEQGREEDAAEDINEKFWKSGQMMNGYRKRQKKSWNRLERQVFLHKVIFAHMDCEMMAR